MLPNQTTFESGTPLPHLTKAFLSVCLSLPLSLSISLPSLFSSPPCLPSVLGKRISFQVTLQFSDSKESPLHLPQMKPNSYATPTSGLVSNRSIFFPGWPRAVRSGRSSHLIPTRNFLLSSPHGWRLPSAPLLPGF